MKREFDQKAVIIHIGRKKDNNYQNRLQYKVILRECLTGEYNLKNIRCSDDTLLMADTEKRAGTP